ncbi:cytochrome c [Hoeflea marina]|uniref:Cytochrome c n=1 Tax=Hoeflea marina TaxID=274592 RepID=A0A317PTA2_9HYPH|nr:c-type cytochrome [Hoeflea marina]PWW04389.1 cytochrome c [Hoeflea marina]
MTKLIRKTALIVLSVVVLAAAATYAGSERRLHKRYPLPVAEFHADSGLPIEEASRRARSFMCLGCHQSAGNVLFQAPLVGTLVAPNISRIAPAYSDGELERLIRHGIKKDGTAALVMPSATLAHLADDDVANIITWLRSLPQQPDAEPSTSSFGPLGRVALALDKLPFEADHTPSDLPALRHRPDDLGSYLVANTCSHCHRLQTDSEVDGRITPPLAVVAQAYSLAEFTTLLRTGKGIGNRELGLMSLVARADFSNFDDAEIASIHEWLQTDPQDGSPAHP